MRDDWAEKVSAQEQFVGKDPTNAAEHHNLSVLYAQGGRIAEAIGASQTAVELAPDVAEAWLHLGNLYAATDQASAAVEAFKTTTKLAPHDSRAWFNLGNVLALIDQRPDAIRALERAKELAPRHSGILASLALAYRKHGRLHDAITTYRAAEDLAPDNPAIGANLIVSHQYVPGISEKRLFELHRKWGGRHTSKPLSSLQASKPNKPCLRIGYVSGDFRRHPVGYFLSGVLKHHDPAVCTSVCLSDTGQRDDMTDRLQSYAQEWHDTKSLNTEAFIDVARELEIDILIDLSGHFRHSRLIAFAQRAAPVQATWAGYVGTTGLDAMDWLIADKHHVPENSEQYVSERVVRMPSDYVCYTPPDYAPPVAPLPCIARSRFTFGCFNNLVKVNADVLALWAQVLSAVPDSRLFLKCKDLEQADLREGVLNSLSGNGVEKDRVLLEGGSEHVDLLAAYNDVDIALDPFPYSGGLTTLEALWMGVPVITKTGQTFAGRHSTAHLRSAGLSGWVVDNDESYVALAIEKATDRERLNQLRQGLRTMVGRSPAWNSEVFTRDLERMYRHMWTITCQESK